MSDIERELLGGAGSGGGGLVGTVTADEVPPDLDDADIKARGYWEQVWVRFRKDRIAIAGGITIILLLLGAFVLAPVAKWLLGHGPNGTRSIPRSGPSLLPVAARLDVGVVEMGRKLIGRDRSDQAAASAPRSRRRAPSQCSDTVRGL